MKKIYLLLISLMFAANSFSQTTVIDQPFNTTTQPTGWSNTGPVAFTTGGAVFAAANGTFPNRVLISPSFGISAFGTVSLNFQINRSTGSGGGNMAVEYSIDGAAYQLVANIVPTSTAFSTQNYNIAVNPPSGSNMVIRFTKSGGNNSFNIKNVLAIGNCTQPASQATNFTATNINSPLIGNATLNWTRGNGTNVLVVLRASNPVNADPQDGTSYTANPAFGSGQQIGTGNYVVYNGPSTTPTVDVTNLLLGTTYHVAIYEYNSQGICYKLPALTGSFVVSVGITYLFVVDMWIPTDPNGISTAADNISILFGSAEIYTTTLINNVMITPFGALTVIDGADFKVNGALQMESTNLNYSSLIVEGTVTGTVTYDRHVNGGTEVIGHIGAGANDLISSPVISSEQFGEFADANDNIKFDTRPEPTGDPNSKLFGPFDKATGTYLLWHAVDNANESIIPGVGYRAASNDNLGFVFTGTVDNAIVTNDIQSSGTQFVPWNLVGNPYPSYINVGAFLNYEVAAGVKNINLLKASSAAIYGYDGDASDGYTIWNQNNATMNIAPGQGFLIPAKASLVAAYDLTFAPSMRVIGNTDDFIIGRSTDTNNSHLRLQAMIGDGTYRTDFYFNDNSTSGLDVGYDAGVFNDRAASKAIYSRLVENSTGIDMGIQSLAYDALGTEIIVPLGINVNAGQQVTVSIAESDLPANIEVYLEDNVTGTFTLLNNSDYIFTPSSTLNSTGRFFLRFSQSTLSLPENTVSSLQIYATSSPRTLFVKGQLEATTTVILYDMLGRQVFTSTLDEGSNSNNVDVSSLSAGVYVVKLNNTLQQKTQKVILK